MSKSYKTEKEAFVSGMTGSTVMHINVISAVALASIALYSALRSRLPATRNISFPISWLILVVPLLLSMTVFANSSGVLSLLLLFPTALLLLIPPRKSGTPLPSNQPSPNGTQRHTPTTPSFPSKQVQILPLPALTTYRAHMMLMTVLAILAVDFPVFPRALAKCESFGVSLMDLGVGSFVFSQGVVSSIPLLKDRSYLNSPLQPKLFSIIRRALPVIFLGLVRVLLVKGTEYPEHVSEYGVHWNFFITLALLPILERYATQQFILSFMGMQNFVLNAPRKDIFSANKEGIISLTGYLAIHLLGLSTGTILLPPSPSFFRRRQQQAQPVASGYRRASDAGLHEQQEILGLHRQTDKTATELFSYTFVWWSLFGLATLFRVGGGVSRQMVNIPYILWVAGFNTSFILGYLIIDLFFFPTPLSKSVYSSTSKLKIPSDSPKLAVEFSALQQGPGGSAPLLDALNKNGLAVFLMANVATGLINLSISTMYTSDTWAMLILAAYTFGISAVAWIFRDRRLLRL
ncbi:GWT1-domain-containing protein [Infundibulicybe gibba]|nr:GWT1-domain-containing protein [Infundibulicybe gibba]